jgi:osmotically-inducible protein OsmY
MKLPQTIKITCFTILFLTGMQTSHAISMSSISDSISTHSSVENSSNKNITTENVNTKKNARGVNDTQNIKPQQNSSLPNPALFVEDAVITSYIHAQLMLQRNVPSVNVSTENAVVSLAGTVDTKEQADTLVKIASSVKGVKFVNTDHLKILNN